jgi:hypothetical protein
LAWPSDRLVALAFAALALQSLVGGQIQVDSHVGQQTASGGGCDRAQLIEIAPEAVALVGIGRVGVAIAQHDPA